MFNTASSNTILPSLIISCILSVCHLDCYAQRMIESVKVEKASISNGLELTSTYADPNSRLLKVMLDYNLNDLKNIHNKNWSYKIRYRILLDNVFIKNDSLKIEKTSEYDVFSSLNRMVSDADNYKIQVIDIQEDNPSNIPDSIYLILKLETTIETTLDQNIIPTIRYTNETKQIEWDRKSLDKRALA